MKIAVACRLDLNYPPTAVEGIPIANPKMDNVESVASVQIRGFFRTNLARFDLDS